MSYVLYVLYDLEDEMPKANVTYDEVATFCESYVRQGNNPDQLSCRIIAEGLGCSSSFGTISALLKKWHAQRAQVAASSIVVTDLDLGPVDQQIRNLVASKCADSERVSAGQLEALTVRLRGTADDLEMVAAENQRLRAEITKLEGMADEQGRTIASLRDAITLIDQDKRVRAPAAPVAPVVAAAAALGGTAAEPIGQRVSLADIAPRLSVLGTQQEALEADIPQPTQPAGSPLSNSDDLPGSAAISDSNTGTEGKPNAQG